MLSIDIYYKKVGNGYPLVLLHGNGENHHIFDELVEDFKQDYQCILIDSRYHGKSIRQGELSYERMCLDVKEVLDECHINECDVIGFSDGGIIALLLAMQDQRVKHMVVIGANTKPQSIKPIYRFPMYLQRLCLLPFCLYHPKARLSYKLTSLMLKQPHIEYTQLENIHIPVLLMAGEHDMILESDMKMMHQSLPYSVLKIIPHGNHFLLRDTYEITYKEIKMFLDACHQEVYDENM